MYIKDSIRRYLDDLAAKTPAPGGGSAAALTGALGAALMSMVCNFTVGKEKYKSQEEPVKAILSESEKSRMRLMELLDLDVQAYKSKDLQKSLDAPLEVCRIALGLARLCPQLAAIGNVNLISDTGCAYDCFEAAFISARRNVSINLKGINDIAKKDAINQELRVSEKEIKDIRPKLEDKIGAVIRG